MIEGIPAQSPKSVPEVGTAHHERVAITDILEAREHVAELIEKGTHPLITAETKYVPDILEHGINFLAKEDGLTGKKFSFIAGTIGIAPLAPKTEERYVLAVDTSVRVEPRLTGADAAFHGVVQFPAGVPANALTIVGKVVNGIYEEADTLEIKQPLQ